MFAGRFGPGVNASPVDHPVVASGFRVEHVLLMSSVLLPDRAEHREVFRAAMGAGWERVSVGMVETESGPLLLVEVAALVAGVAEARAA